MSPYMKYLPLSLVLTRMIASSEFSSPRSSRFPIWRKREDPGDEVGNNLTTWFAMGSKIGRGKNPHFCIIPVSINVAKFYKISKFSSAPDSYPVASSIYFRKGIWKGNLTRSKAFGKEGGKASRFSSFLLRPLMQRELIKSFPAITAHTEKQLGTSLLLGIVFSALISAFNIVLTHGG